MSEQNQPSPEELARQVQQYVQSLKEAGLEWLPVKDCGLTENDAKSEDGPTSHPQSTNGNSQSEIADAPLLPGGNLFAGGAEPELSEEQRRIALDLLKEQVSTCSRCAELLSTRTQTVFGEGPLNAELCFIGEGPGFNEDKQGRPFVGDAGQLLDKMIVGCGFRREQVYICNIVKCRPPGNRTPLVNEAENCREYLEKQLELIKPKYICALGACAAQNLLGTTASIGRLRGRFHDYNGIPVLCTYHPAYLLRSPEKKRDVWEDLKTLLRRMGRPIPKK